MVIKINYTSSDVYVSTSVSPVYVVVNYSGTSGGGGAIWGGITGTLSDQTDLQTALDDKVPYTGATGDVNLGEHQLLAGQLTLDTTPTGTASVGTTRWNDTIGSSETTLKGGNVILKNGVDLVARVVNKVTPNATLTKAAYQAVKISGAQGQRLAVALAQANNDANSADTIGLVTETIATNQEGFIMTVGNLEGINTTGSLQGETWADGDVLYLSPTTAGALTNIKPTGATGHIVVVGYVEYAHANNGKIYVKIMNGWELDELHNVYITSPTNNQVLTYESATSLWKNKTVSADNIYTADGTLTGNRTISSGGFALTINPITTFTENLNITKNQNAITSITIKNTNNNTAALPALYLENNQGTQAASVFKVSSAYTPFKNITASSLGIYNASYGGDIALLNDYSLGKITFAAGSSSTAQMTLTEAGRLLLGTTTESTYLLDINGTARVSGDVRIGGAILLTGTNKWIEFQGGPLIIAPTNFSGWTGISIGGHASGNSESLAIGGSASGINAQAIGKSSSASSTNSHAIGYATNAVGIAAIAIGTGARAGANEFVVGYPYDGGTSNVYFGSGSNRWNGNTQIAGAGYSYTINGSGAFGTDYAGGNITIAGGKGTGSGSSGDVIISTATTTTSGTTLQSLTERWYVKGSTGILANVVSPNASAILQADSTSKGFLMPRMTTAERDAISSPATGLQIYNTTTNENNTYNGTAWVAAGGGSTSPAGSNTQIQYNNSGAFGASANLVWDNTNARLGIGIATPTVKLNVQDSSTLQTLFETTSSSQRVISKIKSPDTYLDFRVHGALSSGDTWFGVNSAQTNVMFTQYGHLLIGTYDSKNLYLGTNNTTRALITAAGRLLLGTTTESTYLLDVNGTARVSNAALINGDVITPNAQGQKLALTVTTNGTTRLSIDSTASGVDFNTGFKLGNGSVSKWSLATYGTNADFVFYNDVTATNSLFIAGSTNNVIINSTTDIPSAILNVTSTTKGFLMPRMTTTQRDAIATPATGLQIYNTTTNENNTYNGTAWVAAGSTSPAGSNTQIQYNNSGAFGASAGLTYNDSTGVMTLSKNQNGATYFSISNTTAGATSQSILTFTNDGTVNDGQIGLYSSTYTSYKFLNARDFVIYKGGGGGDLGFIAEGSGKIKFGAGGTSTAQATLTAAGRLLLGTTTESTYLLDVNGTARVSGDAMVNSLTVGRGGGSIIGNAALGFNSLNSNTSGNSNVAIGYESLRLNTTGSNNIAIGTSALYANTTASSNIAIGVNAMSASTGNTSVAIGNNVLANNSGNGNIGILGLTGNTSGTHNIALGVNVLIANTTASHNIGMGHFSLALTTTGGSNIGIGNSALYYNVTGTNNTAVGFNALTGVTTSNNVGLGYAAGYYITGGSTINSSPTNSIFIGNNTRANGTTETNQIVIGHDATGGGSNTATIGNTSITKTILRGTLNAANLPTSSAGLSAGDIWNDGGTLKIV